MITKYDQISVGKSGGELNIVTADGEVIATIGLSAGLHPASRFLKYQQDGLELAAGAGVDIFAPPSRSRIIVSAEAMESAVVPNYQPSEAKKQADLMEMILRKANLQARKIVAAANKRVTQADRKDHAAEKAAELVAQNDDTVVEEPASDDKTGPSKK